MLFCLLSRNSWTFFITLDKENNILVYLNTLLGSIEGEKNLLALEKNGENRNPSISPLSRINQAPLSYSLYNRNNGHQPEYSCQKKADENRSTAHVLGTACQFMKFRGGKIHHRLNGGVQQLNNEY